MKNISTFGKAMAQVMKGRMAFHGVTQAEMAAAIQLSQSQLSKILRAERTIDLESFEAFCEALDENAADLVKAGESIARRIQNNSPESFVPSATLVFVEGDERLDKPKPALNGERLVVDDEQARVAETLKKLHRGDMDIAALEDEHKYDGDGDDPA